MLRPTPEQILEIKAACRARFGHERVIGIALEEPIDLYVVMAAMGMREASVYVDTRAHSDVQAQSALVVERCLWPAQKMLAAIRTRRGALDAAIELQYRQALGWYDGSTPTLQRFSVQTAPAGFAAPDDLVAKVAELQAEHPAAELWSITRPGGKLGLVVAAPEEDVYQAARLAFQEAVKAQKGGLTLFLAFMRDIIVWSPKPLDAYLEEAPGRAEDLGNPFLEMGGATAKGSASFL